MKLIIVESPGKVKKISEILGQDGELRPALATFVICLSGKWELKRRTSNPST